MRTYDVMELLNRIVATHGVPLSIDPGQQKLEARTKYYSCRQRSFEDTADYYKRFKKRICVLRALDSGVPDDDQQALDFFMTLDDAKYDYRANKAETQLQNIEKPINKPLRKARQHNVYAAVVGDGGRGRGRQANNGGRDGSGG